MRARRSLLLASLVVSLLVGPGTAAAGASEGGCPPSGGAGLAEVPGASGDVVVTGGGWGHGLGMSQYGAQGAARLGCDHGTVLRTYYPGLVPAVRPLAGQVQVRLADAGGRAEVTAETGPVTWVTGSRRVVQPAGTTWSTARDGAAVAVRSGTAASSATVLSGSTVLAQHPGAVVRTATWARDGRAGTVRRSSGETLRLAAAGGAGTDVRVVLVDDARGSAVARYLRALAEMPVSWPEEAQAAQVVAARSYLAGRWVAAEGAYVVRPTSADQVWGGYDTEVEDARHGGHLARAVARTTSGTSGEVMTTASGAVAKDLFYASSHGGWSDTNAFVWGSSPVGHLRRVDDTRWDAASSNPYRAWSVGMDATDVARAFGLTSLTAVEVAPRGSSARTAVVIRGTRDGRAVSTTWTGQQARDRLASVDPRVRSSGFTVRGPAATVPTPQPAPAPAPRPTPTPVPVGPALTGGVPLVGDWDGNGRDEPGWWDGGRVAVRLSSGEVRRWSFGRAGDVPVVGDWDGNGVDSVGVFRGGQWFLRNGHSSGGHDVTFRFGGRGDVPVVGSWNGRQLGVGVVASNGTRWLLAEGLGGPVRAQMWWGRAGDRPFVGDWDGDGKDTPGLRRGKDRFLLPAFRNVPASPVTVGRADMKAFRGDLDGDGADSLGVAVGSTFAWRDDLRSGAATTTTTFAG